MSVRIEIDFKITRDFVKVYAESLCDQFVGNVNNVYDEEKALTELQTIARTQTYAGHPRHGFLKIYVEDKLVGFSLPRIVQKREYEIFKLLDILTYHRLGTIYVLKSERNKGYVSKAIQLYEEKHPDLAWTCCETNTASAATALKNGFKLTHKLYYNAKKEASFEKREDTVRTSLMFSKSNTMNRHNLIA